MPAARVSTLAVALLSLSGRASGIEDAAALIQQRQAVEGALEASSSGDVERILPAVGADGLRFSRISAVSEPGSNIFLNYSKFCEHESSDSFGVRECSLYFGMPFYHTFNIHLDGGVKSGDVLSQSFTLDLDDDQPSSLAKSLVPDHISMHSKCGLCEDSCHVSAAEANFSLNITIPTPYDGPHMCNMTPKMEDLVIANQTTFWFRPPKMLLFKGDFNTSVGVLDKDGNARAEAKYLYRMSGADSPAMLAAGVGSAREEAERPAELPLEIVGLLREVLLGTEAEATEAASESAGIASAGSSQSLADLLGSGSHAIALNLTVKDIAPGNSISVSSSKGCNATDSSGSVVCEFNVNDTVIFSTAVDVSFTATEGSTMYVSSKVGVGGNFGIVFRDGLRKKRMTAPLCGASTTITDAKGIAHKYQPGKCGDYAVKFQSTAREFKKMAEFASTKLPAIPLMPFLPKSVEALLPLSHVAELELTNADNSTILSVAVDFMLKKL